MNGIISPFQMSYNKVINFHIIQYDDVLEFSTTSVSLGADFVILDFINENERHQAKLNLLINLIGKTDKDEKLFEINLSMIGLFYGDANKLEEKRFIEMLKINGISTLMQLSRAYVTSTTALSGFMNPVNFPLVNVFELIKLKEGSNDDE